MPSRRADEGLTRTELRLVDPPSDGVLGGDDLNEVLPDIDEEVGIMSAHYLSLEGARTINTAWFG